ACIFILLLAPYTTHAAQINISITDDQFTPRNVTVNPGDTVVWVNNGSMAHTVTADNASFDSGTLQPGQSYPATFSAAGTYAYHCKFHGGPGGQGMAGTITVGGPAVTLTNSTSYSNPAYTTTGSSADQLRAQAQGLLAQIAALQAQ